MSRKAGHLSNEGAQARLRNRESDVRRRYDDDLRFVMKTPEGRRFIWRLLDDTTGVFAVSFVPNSNQAAFNDGRRSVGVYLMSEAGRVASPEFVRMQTEQFKAAEENALRKAQAEATPDED